MACAYKDNTRNSPFRMQTRIHLQRCMSMCEGGQGGAAHMCLPYNVNAWQPSKLCNNQIQRTHDTISGLHMRSHFIASSIHPANKAADYRAHRRRWRCNNHFGYHH